MNETRSDIERERSFYRGILASLLHFAKKLIIYKNTTDTSLKLQKVHVACKITKQSLCNKYDLQNRPSDLNTPPQSGTNYLLC